MKRASEVERLAQLMFKTGLKWELKTWGHTSVEPGLKWSILAGEYRAMARAVIRDRSRVKVRR